MLFFTYIQIKFILLITRISNPIAITCYIYRQFTFQTKEFYFLRPFFHTFISNKKMCNFKTSRIEIIFLLKGEEHVIFRNNIRISCFCKFDLARNIQQLILISFTYSGKDQASNKKVRERKEKKRKNQRRS